MPKPRLTILDVSRTSGLTVPIAEAETIEIGAIVIDYPAGNELASFEMTIQPVRHPLLTPTCLRLTNLRQIDVDDSTWFPHVYSLFLQWREEYPSPIVSWSRQPFNQLERDCAYHKIPWTLGQPAVVVGEVFARDRSYSKSTSIGEALRRLRMDFQGKRGRPRHVVTNVRRIIQRTRMGLI